MSSDLQQLAKLSRYAGQRFDFVQAGGGNTSIKTPEGELVIKASGFLLSEVSETRGFTRLKLKPLLDIVADEKIRQTADKGEREAAAAQQVQQHVVEGPRPSIETLLHAISGKVTLHTHPLGANVLTCKPDWEEQLGNAFPGAALVPYATPGYELTLALEKALAGKPLKTAFFQNHGLIVSGDSVEEVIGLHEEVCRKCNVLAGWKDARYDTAQQLTRNIQEQFGIDKMLYVSNDATLLKAASEAAEELKGRPFCPDMMVFCGARTVFLDSHDLKPIADYRQEFGTMPQVIVYQNRTVMLLADHVKKAREAEEVLRFHLHAARLAGPGHVVLSKDELMYLAHWDAEKYRQKL